MATLPANYIRLLHIEAGSDKQDICCRLVSTSLTSSISSYEALSYTWGIGGKTSVITCDGSPLPVTQNLYEALRHLRRPDGERTVWVDAVCINQDDNQERTEQVQMMRNIYENASHVVIWLGEETEGDKTAFSILNRFKEIFAKYGLVSYGITENVVYKLGLPEFDSEEWFSFANLFQRPWFQRIWVIQEVFMARKATVTCGSFTVDWDLIAQVARALQQNGVIGQYEIEGHAPGLQSVSVINSLNYDKQQNQSWKLINLLRRTRNYQATDPRDKIFALVGISPNAEIRVDYSMSTEEAYVLLAIHTLEAQKTLICLSSAGVSSSPEVHKLPSWVPDWSHNNDRRFNLGAGNRFCAAGDSQPILSISTDKKILTIRGYAIDSLTHVNTGHRKVADVHINPNLETEQVRRGLIEKRALERCDKLVKFAFTFPKGQTFDDALWRTLCCDLQPHGARATVDYGIGYKFYRMFLNMIGDDGKSDSSKFDKEFFVKNWTARGPFFHGALIFSIGRNVCVTAEGYLGRVPHGSVVGDKICVLMGGTVPFVIREEDDGCFRFIGECYIHGIMDGETMKREDLESITRDFQIR